MFAPLGQAIVFAGKIVRNRRMRHHDPGVRSGRRALRFLAAAILPVLAGCGGGGVNPAPPRVTEPAEIPTRISRIALPVSVPLAELERLLNAEAPQTLLTIDQQEKACVPSARLTVCLKHERPCKGDACKDVPCKVGFRKARVTPTLGCRIVGSVERGPIRLSGSGENLRLTMPVTATVSAKDVGKLVSETATAAAEVRARVKLGTAADWSPTATIEIDYGWTEKPGIELLGRRITFAGRADPKLGQVIARLEADLPRQLKSLALQKKVDEAWRRGFTSVSLNRRNPEVWMRITPQRLGYGGYIVRGRDLVLDLGLEATTETFLGARPADPPVAPLPPRVIFADRSGLSFYLPVVADYSQLEPVLEKALTKLAARPIAVPVAGNVRVTFGRPTIYTTEAGKIAIGLPISASGARQILSTRGVVWLTGLPYNARDSRKVYVRDLGIAGRADGLPGSLLLAVAESPAVIGALETALAQDFSRDFGKLMAKVDKALTNKRVGDFVLSAKVTEVKNGVVTPVGQGLFLPVQAFGLADLRYSPAPDSVR
jgi:hypothetical protein